MAGRIGIFGGAFDPVHYGHLILAEQCREQATLDEVWFVPTAHHPFKADDAVSPFEQRVALLKLAIATQPAFRIVEIERELPAPGYTANMIEELHRRNPGTEFHFLVGGDALVELPTWHAPQRIVAAARLVAMARPGHPVLSVGDLRTRLQLPAAADLHLQVVDVPLIDLSSRDIRRRIAAGRSVRFMLPRDVEEQLFKQRASRG